MSFLRLSYPVFCLTFILGAPASAWSQSESQNAEKIQALQKQLDDMKAQMQNIQAQILDLSSAVGRPPTTVTTTAAGAPTTTVTATAQDEGAAQAAALHVVPARQVSQATATYQTNSEDQIAAPRIDNAPLDPRFPGYFRLPGTQTLLRIGGYFKTDFIYDLKPPGNTDSFIPSTFPIPTVATVNNTTVSIRPTRLNLDFLIPVKSSSVRFFLEMDMFGSSATTPRLRHAYAQFDNFLLGQTFSNFMDPDSGPDTLDFQGPNSQVSIRNPQFRYSIPLAKKTSLSFSVEKASSDVSFSTPQFKSLPDNPTPDAAIKFRQDYEKGHIQVSGLFRDVAAYLPDGRNASVFGWGVNLTGAQKLGADTFVYQAAYGAGMERYVNDTSGLGIDAQPADAARPHLEAVPLTAIYGGYQHYWVKKLRSSAVYGFAQTQNTDLQPSSSYHQSNYGAANIIWNPIGSLNVGGEILYGWLVHENKASADDTRFMFSAKYSFIKMGETKK
jgi:DcaP outer membrane protein